MLLCDLNVRPHVMFTGAPSILFKKIPSLILTRGASGSYNAIVMSDLIEIDDDDEYFARFLSDYEVSMNDIYHGKILLNVLSRWKGSFSDENLMRVILDRFPGDTAKKVGWPLRIGKIEDAWITKQRETNEFVSTNFPNYGKFLTKDDILDIIINPMVAFCPEYGDPFPLTRTCQTLGELLDLSEEERIFLQLAIDMKDLPYPIEAVYPRVMQCFDNKVEMYSAMFGFTKDQVRDIMSGFLIKSGFLTPSTYPEGFYAINKVFGEYLTNRDMGIEDIESIIFPNNLSTDLELSDYKHIENDVARSEKIIRNALENNIAGTNILFWGPAGTGKTELAAAMAKKNGWEIKSIGDISESDTEEKSRADRLTNLKIALKLFTGDGKTVLLFDEIEDLFKVDNNATFSKAFINRIIETTTVPIIWTTNSLMALGSPVLRRMTYNIHCTTPPKSARRTMWEKYADKYGVSLDEDTKKMLDCFDIPPALIHNSMKVTGTAVSQDENTSQEDVREIVTSLDRLVNYGVKRRFPPVDKDDPFYDVTCVNTEHSLEEFTNRLKNATSPAFSLCLYGPPGTGKSKYGRYLASQLGKQILFKRASDLVSCWVGVTEQNIAAAFAEAKEEGKVLLIDEGDSFLQNRERAKQSWEISQVNEMLSQMEEHPEPFILTTNLMDNLDPASLRRFTFKMKFDYLRPDQARRLFELYYKTKAPARISKMHLLTPGDIACVQKQVNILGLKDGEEIYKMIEREIALKPEYSRSIGF